MVNILTKTLSNAHSNLQTTGLGIGNTHRRISLGFFPPNKKNLLVRKYRKRRNRVEDQRSYYSLGEDFSSSVRDSSLHPFLGDIIEEIGHEGNYSHGGDELSRTVSLPSHLSDVTDYISDNDRNNGDNDHMISFMANSDIEDQAALSSIAGSHNRESDYDEFMKQIYAYKNNINSQLSAKVHTSQRRPSFVTVSSRGSIPTVYQERYGTHPELYGGIRPEDVTYMSELAILCSYSFPLIFTFLLEQIFPIVCSITVAHLGKTELASVSLGAMTSNITLAVFEGISTSLDTLCPQAYGAGRHKSVGIHMQRCIVFSLILYIPFAFMWYYSEHLLKLVIPEKELVTLTSQFLRVQILGAPGYIGFENLKRFLQAQGIFDAGIYVLMICAPLNILMSYLLVWNKYIGFGFIGSAIAVVINFWLMFILLVLYVIFIDGKKCWGGFSKKAFKHWKDLAQLAFSGIIMLEAEELSYELLTLFSSYFGSTYLAVQSAVSTMAALLYMVPFAIGIATSTRIANFIGAKLTHCAYISSQVGLSMSQAAGLVNCFLLIGFRKHIARIFSQDAEVIELIIDLLPLVGCVQIFDALNAVAGSCLRGQGMQTLGSIVNLITYYLFAIPFGMFLSQWYDLKLYGLWIGIGSGMFIIGVIESYYVLKPDWEQILNYSEILKETENDEDSNSEYFTDSDNDESEDTPLLN
ncbi:hypothetical protein TPHA_0H01560 [Tetrapisispora phaffii CBS 4417]|uniref:Uncharacterized protein n=1 Tax=Tetrapisispora phaffii (strain ATCC 24235 / CBS 4417 / NBRC 1672 / NRRL Y-8282 / UCD 70-5) TaxID=1071381 RepID=G8BX58_TETPH|nr:hypothetical protein TPHA_0H01560 [Tetrapisispora phaffii CBS 4417]CCE64362.1 hypothetical protein TPHA_0H01560 [Tetrapisispora phaffii CBS 4417]